MTRIAAGAAPRRMGCIRLRVWLPVPPVVAALVLAAVAGGCGDDGGGDDRPAASPTTTHARPTPRRATAADRAAVKATVRRYLTALRTRDAKRYCSAFTESQRDFIASSQSAADCPSGQRKAWRAAEGQLGAARIDQLYSAYAKSEVFDVEVTRTSATAALDVPVAAGPLYGADTVSLSREGGRWLIDDEIGS